MWCQPFLLHHMLRLNSLCDRGRNTFYTEVQNDPCPSPVRQSSRFPTVTSDSRRTYARLLALALIKAGVI